MRSGGLTRRCGILALSPSRNPKTRSGGAKKANERSCEGLGGSVEREETSSLKLRRSLYLARLERPVYMHPVGGLSGV